MKFLAFFISCFLVTSCQDLPEPSFKAIPENSPVEAISLLGDSLRAPTFSDSIRAVFVQNLVESGEDYKADSTNIDNIIWYGRRLAYLGEYQKAIEVFSKGIELHKNEPRLYRHRGHRYITLRAFDYAIADFEKAGELITGKEDIVEPDGLPNARNMPRSSLHTNIWYHLGLSYYLTGDLESAAKAYQKCIMASTNDDMLVAAVYWYYMTLKRNGQDELAGKIIEPIHADMDIIENDSYLKLLLVFKAEFDPELILNENSDALSNATTGYGIGNWHYINSRKERASEIWSQVYKGNSWASFGYIASEAELAGKHE
ncbi:MAG: tetratricopeptide repeat protein [Balneolaceae bacterium]|nr:tetratricopeptide repeat protein [Balneolaceae bacterium]MBO6545897.1 tetratricopeptide repeat protein [Balneolaceae bacterium]MBO6647293.1 tetratricopeptide repeat protein [Balneolaceae bacterium]